MVTDGRAARQAPEHTVERRITWWQRALRWVAWLAKPLGGPKYELREPTHLLGAFVSRTSWGLVLFGALLTLGGVAGSMAAIYDVSTGRATIGDVFKDIAVFIEGWIAELIAGWSYDAELEKTHAYALFLLLIPGLLLLCYNLIPFFNRGNEFQVHPTDRSPCAEVTAGNR